jgi:hypothetical protein
MKVNAHTHKTRTKLIYNPESKAKAAQIKRITQAEGGEGERKTTPTQIVLIYLF